MTDIYSPTKALFHAERIKTLQENRQIAPTLLQVDLMAYCNDNCNFCSYRKEDGYNTEMLKLIDAVPGTENKPLGHPTDRSMLPQDFATRLPLEMMQAGIPAIELTGGGEPTLWPGFTELLRTAGRYSREIGLVTNGSNLNLERIQLLVKYGTWVRFSMDASNEITHQKVHRTANLDFQRRINTIIDLVALRNKKKSKLTIGVSFLINKDNRDDLFNSVIFYKKIGVDNLRVTWMYDRKGNAGFDEESIAGIKKELEDLKAIHESESFKVLFSGARVDFYSQPNTDFNRCYIQHFVWAIGGDSLVYPCCIMKYNPAFALADLRKNTLLEIIQDPEIHKRMTSLDPKACYPCWLRDRNKTIAYSIVQPPHHNFL